MTSSRPVRRPGPQDEPGPWIRVAIWLVSAVLLAWIGWFVAIWAFFVSITPWGDGTLTFVLTALWAVPGTVALLLAPVHLCSMFFDRHDPVRSRVTQWMAWSLGTAFGMALLIIVVGRLAAPST